MRHMLDVRHDGADRHVLRIGREAHATACGRIVEHFDALVDPLRHGVGHPLELRLGLIVVKTVDVEGGLSDVVKANIRLADSSADRHILIDFFDGWIV